MMVLAVKKERLDEEFVRMFGRPSAPAEFVEWCVSWGGRVAKDKCVFEPEEA